MTPHLNLQTMLTVVDGSTRVPVRAFVWGKPTQPFSVGTRGDWMIDAPGVEAVHFYLGFDGKVIHVAGLPSGAPVLLSGVPIDHTWRFVPIASELRFGKACIRVTCQEAPWSSHAEQTAAPAPASPGSHPLQRDPAELGIEAVGPGFAQTARTSPPVPGATQFRTQPVDVPEIQFRTQPVDVPEIQFRTQPVDVPEIQFRTQPIEGSVVQARVEKQGPKIAPMPIVPVASGQVFQAPLASPGAPRSPSAENTLSSSVAEGDLNPVPSTKRRLQEDAGAVSTLNDQGALREHAVRFASSEAPPKDPIFLGEERAGSPAPGFVPVPESFEPPVPAPVPHSALGAGAPEAAEQDSSTDGKKKRTTTSSWVMRANLVLLPIAGYFALFWEPASGDPPVSNPDSQATSRASSTPAPLGSTALLASVGIPAPAPTSVSASETRTASKGDARTAPSTPTTGGPTGPSSAQTSALLQRDALNAAFEGRLTEAARLYDGLATGPDARVYALAARLSRKGAVKKP